jgi:hypothetical protein
VRVGAPCLFARVHLSVVAFGSRRAGPSLDMSYNYVVTAQKPTAVNGCVTGEAGRAGDPGEGGSWWEPRPKGGPRPQGRPGRTGLGSGRRWRPRTFSQPATSKELS